MPSLKASFTSMFSTSSANLTHLVPRHHVVNVLVPALAKLAAQLVADLLIAVGPPAAALLIGHLLRAHAHAQHVRDLEARCRLSLWRTRRNDWQSRSSSAYAAPSCTASWARAEASTCSCSRELRAWKLTPRLWLLVLCATTSRLTSHA